MFGLTLQSKLDEAEYDRDEWKTKYEISNKIKLELEEQVIHVFPKLVSIKEQIELEMIQCVDWNERASLKRILNLFN